MTRRDLLLASAVGAARTLSGAGQSRLSVEAYIFQQYAQRQHKKLSDVLAEAIPMARRAGFHNIELNGEFFAPEVESQTLALVRSSGLKMPSVYSGGALHDPELAQQTIERALAIAKICQPFGCTAVVCNADPKKGGAEKTDAELAVQAEQMNRMGRLLARNGFELRVHNHTPEMVSGAREWRYTLAHTDPKSVSLCLDLDWVHQGGQDPLALLKEAGSRVHEVHVRNAKDKLWLEDLEDGDVDYRAIADYLRTARLDPLIVVELAYRENTKVTRPLEKDLEISRAYAERVFGMHA
ncbi:MAG TPA: sugar phosphate isomerase/epimerase [Bryobacteraceae bacterium]